MTDPSRTGEIAGVVDVAWADVVGTGFTKDERGRPAPREYWQAAQSLLRADVVQPPETIRSTLSHPMWSLRHVRVDGRGGHWCFAVQGRGGAFGAAGTCRFWFFPVGGVEEWSPGDAWRAGSEAARATQPEVLAPRPDRAVVTGVLAALTAGHRRIAVPGSPTEVAQALGAVLRVVPYDEVASRVWATCLLQPPEPQDRRLVAGRWPDDLRATATPLPRYLGTLDQLLAAPPPTSEALHRLLDGPRREALDWLVAQAQAHPDRRDANLARLLPQARSVADVLGWRAANVPPSPSEVPSLLTTTLGRERLHTHPEVLWDWAEARPDQARRRLAGERDPVLRREIFAGLLNAQYGVGANVLGLPLPGDRVDGAWPERLAELICETRPAPASRAQLIRRLHGPTEVISTEHDLVGLHDWLLRLGLDPFDTGADLFPDRVRAITDAIQRRNPSAPNALAELRRGEPVLFQDVLSQVGALPAPRAAELLAAAPSTRPEQVGDWAAELTGTVGTDSRETWLNDLVAELRQRGATTEFVRAVDDGGRRVRKPSHTPRATRPAPYPRGREDAYERPLDGADRRSVNVNGRWLQRGGPPVNMWLVVSGLVIVSAALAYGLHSALVGEPDQTHGTQQVGAVESPAAPSVEPPSKPFAAQRYTWRYECAYAEAGAQSRVEQVREIQRRLEDIRAEGQTITLLTLVGSCADALRSELKASDLPALRVPIATAPAVAGTGDSATVDVYVLIKT